MQLRDRSTRFSFARRLVALALLVVPTGLAGAGVVAAAEFFDTAVVDNSADVGYAASLAFDSTGKPHIAYYDQTNGDLKYASWNGATWIIETADGLAGLNVGTHASLAIDGSDRPHISYYDQTNADLKYCRKNAGVWTAETVDSAIPPRGWFTSIALDAAGNPRISYQDQTSGDLKYAAKNGGIWTRESVDVAGNVGWYTALALDAAGNPRISYFDFTNQDLKFAARNGATWSIETVDAADCKGSYTSLALKGGNPVIAYFDCTNSNLRLAEKVGASWQIAEVDTAGDVGEHTSLRIASDGQPRVSYARHPNAAGFDGGIRYAWRSSGGQWAFTSIDTAAHYTYFTSLRLDSHDVPTIAYQDFHGNDVPPGDSILKLAQVQFPSAVPELPAPAAGLLRVTPNPIVATARIALTLERPVARLQVQVFDVSGRVVNTLHDGAAPVGPFEVIWDGRTAEGGSAVSGLYYVRAAGPGVNLQARAVVVR